MFVQLNALNKPVLPTASVAVIVPVQSLLFGSNVVAFPLQSDNAYSPYGYSSNTGVGLVITVAEDPYPTKWQGFDRYDQGPAISDDSTFTEDNNDLSFFDEGSDNSSDESSDNSVFPDIE